LESHIEKLHEQHGSREESGDWAVKANRQEILVVGHRGACGYEPENTFTSFDLAVKQGADILEFDVHLTKDGVPVVIHDDTLQRTTSGSGKVAQKSLAEIKTFNAAAKKAGHSFEPIPTLEDVVVKYLDKVRLMVEIKHGSNVYKGIEEKVISVLERAHAIKQSEIISFDFDCIRRVRVLREDVSTGIIFVGKISDFTRLAKQIGCSALHPSHDYVTSEDMRQARETTNLQIYVWTVNGLEEIQRLCNVLKPDGIVTNYPDRVSREVRKLRLTGDVT